MDLDPYFEKVYFKAGRAYKKIGNLEKALEVFIKGVSLGSGNPTLRKEIEDTRILLKYHNSLEDNIQKKEYKDALRKITNLLDNCEGNIELIKKKIEVLVFYSWCEIEMNPTDIIHFNIESYWLYA